MSTPQNSKNLDDIKFGARIKVVGVGGSGSNAVDHMINSGVHGVDFICVNCDVQDLHHNKAEKKIHIGKNLTKGLGAGMNPEVGRRAAEETKSELQEALKNTDMVFITCGLGGGTGTGAAPIVAEIAKNQGSLTLAIVTRPFSFEGVERARIAEEGLKNLLEVVDTVIVIPNDRLLEITGGKTTLIQAFALCDDVLKNAVQGISELIIKPGIINLDFADVRTVMTEAGPAIMGIGIAAGENRAVEAARAAISSPLLDFSIDGARGILFAVAGGDDLTLSEINEAAKLITASVDPQAKIIFGAFHDENLKKGEVKITVIAAGFSNQGSKIISKGKGPPEKISNYFQEDIEKDDTDVPAFLRRGKSPLPSEKKPGYFKFRKDDQRTHHSTAQMDDMIEMGARQYGFLERRANSQTSPRTSKMRDFYNGDKYRNILENTATTAKVILKKIGETLLMVLIIIVGGFVMLVVTIYKWISHRISNFLYGLI